MADRKPEEVEAARQRLRRWPMYDPITNDRAAAVPSYTVQMLIDVFAEMGVSIKPETIKAWCRQGNYPGAINFGGQIGWRIPWGDIIIDLDRRRSRDEPVQDDAG